MPVTFSCEIPKGTFYAGEKIPMKIDVDNTKCFKEIVKVKAKITMKCIAKFRQSFASGYNVCLSAYKLGPTVPGNEFRSFQFDFTAPEVNVGSQGGSGWSGYRHIP